MDPNDRSAPGYAIVRRPRNAVSDRFPPFDFAERRADSSIEEESAYLLDALAGGLGEIEERIDMVQATLDPAAADRLRAELARAGAELIDARFGGPNLANETITGLRDTILALEAELAAARRQHESDGREIERLRNRTAQLADGLHNANRKADLDRRRIAELEEQVAELEADIALATARVAGLRGQEVAQLRQQTGDLQLAVHDMRCRLLAQNEESEQLRMECDVLKAHLSDTQKLLRATHTELTRARVGLAQAGQRVAVLEAENRSLSEGNARLTAENGEQAEENALMEQWLNNALARYSSLQEHTSVLERLANRSAAVA